MKKRWIILGVGGLAFVGVVGYFGWTEVLGGASALSGRDYPAERAALLERVQTEKGRAAGAVNFFDELEKWEVVDNGIHKRLTDEWAVKGKKWPGFAVPLRTGSPQRTEENREEMALSDEAAAEFYSAAVKAGLLDALAKTAAAPRAVRENTGPVFTMAVEASLTKPGRELARLARYRMIEAAKAKDAAGYLEANAQLLRIADAYARQHTVMDRLIATALLAMEQGGVRDDLETGAIDAVLAEKAVAAMTASVAGWPSWSVPFEGEAIDSQEALAAGKNGRFMGSGEVAQLRWAYEELERGADLPRVERTVIFDGVDAAVAKAPVWRARLRMMIPAMTSVGRSKDQIETQTNGMVALVAVERYRQAEGSLPESLEKLVPKYLSVVPRDPFGDVLKYVRVEASGTASSGYLIYSVGFDGKDDGGKVSPKGAYEAFKKAPASTGFDYPLSGVDR